MIRVLIERHIDESKEDELRQVLLDARQEALRIPGYISGESLHDASERSHHVVISTWRSRQDWDVWMESEGRMKIQNRLDPLLLEPEKITVLEPL